MSAPDDWEVFDETHTMSIADVRRHHGMLSQISKGSNVRISSTARPVEPLFTARRRLAIAMVVIACLVLVGQAKAREGGVRPIPAPTALVRARAVCPVTATRTCYLTALRHAYQAIEWAKKERARRYAPTVALAIAVACASQPSVDCGWLHRMIGCESQGDPHAAGNPRARNRSSTAKGLAEFLDGTWRATPYGHLDVFDPFANALAAAWLAARSGRGPWYSSRGCWA